MAELDRWNSAGARPTLWLRDDDAVEPTPALDQLIDVCDRTSVPVLLAVVPEGAGEPLARRIEAAPLVTPCQHGVAHRNHAPAGARARELGARPLAATVADLIEAREKLFGLFGARLAPVLVPPWNRIDEEVVAALPGVGFVALSTFGFTPLAPTPGLREINTHVDIIDWKRGRVGRSIEHVALQLAEALSRARLGGLPVGVLTHHLAHDAQAWRVLETVLERLASTPLVRWAAFGEL